MNGLHHNDRQPNWQGAVLPRWRTVSDPSASFGFTKIKHKGPVKSTTYMVSLIALNNLWLARRAKTKPPLVAHESIRILAEGAENAT